MSIKVTWDTANKAGIVNFSNNNLEVNVINYASLARANVGKTEGKWYWEIKVIEGTNSMIGVVNSDVGLSGVSNYYEQLYSKYYWSYNGAIFPQNIAYGSSLKVNDILGIALDVDNKKIKFFKNGLAYSELNLEYTNNSIFYPSITNGGSGNNNDKVLANFGDSPFVYPIPNGYRGYDSILNKTLILHEGIYKKLIGGNPSVVGAKLNPIMTSNTAPSGIASASAIYDTSHDAWKAFNDVKGTAGAQGWVTPNNVTSGWLKYKFNTSTRVDRYKVTGREASVLGQPKTWTFEASNNDVDWVTLDTRTNQIGWTDGEERTFTFNNNNSYLYYRINVSETNGFYRIIIQELELWTQDKNETKSSWQIVSSTLPTPTQFIEKGMDSLSPLLDRKVMQLEPQVMENKIGILPQGSTAKVFSKKIDLNKYMDIRKIEVK